MSYVSLKKFIQEHRLQIGIVASLILVFFAGVGTGKFEGGVNTHTNSNYTNYTTKTAVDKTPEAPAAKPEAADGGVVAGQVTPPVDTAPAPPATASTSPCKVKGNISSKEKIYHVAGGSFYDRVKPEQCFNTEQEAQAAGFRKSTR